MLRSLKRKNWSSWPSFCPIRFFVDGETGKDRTPSPGDSSIECYRISIGMDLDFDSARFSIRTCRTPSFMYAETLSGSALSGKENDLMNDPSERSIR